MQDCPGQVAGRARRFRQRNGSLDVPFLLVSPHTAHLRILALVRAVFGCELPRRTAVANTYSFTRSGAGVSNAYERQAGAAFKTLTALPFLRQNLRRFR